MSQKNSTDSPNTRFYAKRGSQLLGRSSLQINSPIAEIMTLQVEPEVRRQQVATALLNTMTTCAKKAGATTIEITPINIASAEGELEGFLIKKDFITQDSIIYKKAVE